MTEKRFFSIDYDEEYYIFDSTKISKEEVLEKAEYSYDVFGESLMEDDVVNLLNENEQLKQSNNEAIELILDGIVEMHDGKRDYAETIFNKAIKLLKGDVE